MYQIKCDDAVLLDLRDSSFIVSSPKLTLEVNKACEASFNIFASHPNYDRMRMMRSVFEISDDNEVLFRGRMTDRTIDINKGKAVDLEGSAAFFNDSIVKPFDFPTECAMNENYIAAAESGNVVEYFLNWIIENHNSQVQDFQKLYLGKVTVADPNNYITRSSEKILSSWKCIEEKLFNSPLGGFLYISYKGDKAYVNYVKEFELTNTQEITYSENLLDLKDSCDASTTYSALIPIGAEVEEEITDENGNTDKIKKQITIETLEDGRIGDDIVKRGDTIYSETAVEAYGWIYAPLEESTWEDVTEPVNLLNKSVEQLSGTASLLKSSLEFNAVDLHFSNKEIASFRAFRNVKVNAPAHGQVETLPLTRLAIELLNPQATKITVGVTKLTLTESNAQNQQSTAERYESVVKDVEEARKEITRLENETLTLSSKMYNTASEVVMGVVEKYVKAEDYEAYKAEVESNLTVWARGMAVDLVETTKKTNTIGDDLQSVETKLEKHFNFDLENGLEIRAGENAMTLTLDNDIIHFKKNGQQFGLWDGINFHTGNIVIGVDERAQFGTFAAIPRSDKSLMWMKVGD